MTRLGVPRYTWMAGAACPHVSRRVPGARERRAGKLCHRIGTIVGAVLAAHTPTHKRRTSVPRRPEGGQVGRMTAIAATSGATRTASGVTNMPRRPRAAPCPRAPVHHVRRQTRLTRSTIPAHRVAYAAPHRTMRPMKTMSIPRRAVRARRVLIFMKMRMSKKRRAAPRVLAPHVLAPRAGDRGASATTMERVAHVTGGRVVRPPATTSARPTTNPMSTAHGSAQATARVSVRRIPRLGALRRGRAMTNRGRPPCGSPLRFPCRG